MLTGRETSTRHNLEDPKQSGNAIRPLILGLMKNRMMLTGGECTLYTRHSRVQQLGSTHLSGPTTFAHGQRITYKPCVINNVMVTGIIVLALILN